MQYETSRNGSPATTSLVFRRPVCGFSINHAFGRRWPMISRVLATILSASARFLGVLAVARAREYCWHGGLAHMNEYVPGAMVRQLSRSRTSEVHVALHLRSMSRESTSNPTASRLLSTLPVPLNSTNARGLTAIWKAQRKYHTGVDGCAFSGCRCVGRCFSNHVFLCLGVGSSEDDELTASLSHPHSACALACGCKPMYRTMLRRKARTNAIIYFDCKTPKPR